jgi:DNA gyrase subunit B
MDQPDSRKILPLSEVESVRLRPAMYVSNTGFFGICRYLKIAIALLLEERPSQLSITASGDGFILSADVAVPIHEGDSGELAPFEGYSSLADTQGFRGTVLNGLSEHLTVEVQRGGRVETVMYHRGTRASRIAVSDGSGDTRTTLRFVPDRSILTVTHISPAVFSSYLRQLSFLNERIRFTIAWGAERREFFAERGLPELFASLTAPHEIFHEPIHIAAKRDSLELEAVFAYHSWKESRSYVFLNGLHASEGGTHEDGLNDAFDRLYGALELPEPHGFHRFGVVGVAALSYPDVSWVGCLWQEVGNPELRRMVCDLVLDAATEWLDAHPEVARQSRAL